MATNQLRLLIDQLDLSVIYNAGLRVTLGVPIGNADTPDLIWHAFMPFTSNLIKFRHDYGIYASQSPLQVGQPIQMMSLTAYPARDAATYPLLPSRTFGDPFRSGPVPCGSYGVQNRVEDIRSLTFGLNRAMQINGTNLSTQPLCAIAVASKASAVLTPSNAVTIWLQPQYQSSVFIGSVEQRSARAAFGSDGETVTLKYDAACGIFVPADR